MPYMVTDSNAKAGPRKHEIPVVTGTDGEVLQTKTYELKSEVPTEMPESHAMFFLRDPSFHVFDEAGNIVKPVPVIDGGMGGFALAEDQLIATYDELAKESLYRRCKVIAGSDSITAKSKPEEMIAFLKARAKPAAGRGRGSELAIGEASKAELDLVVPQ